MNNSTFPSHPELNKPKQQFTPLPQMVQVKKKGSRVGMFFLILIIIGLSGYVSYDLYTEYRLDRDNQVVNFVINEIAKLAVQCEEIPLIVGDGTINLIAVDCLNFGEDNG